MSNILMQRVVDYIHSTNFESLPQEIVEVAKRAIIDTVGVAVAGWRETVVNIVKETYLSVIDKENNNTSLWGEPTKIRTEYAALINGTASHALDYDDVTPTALAHPSAPILAAVIPLAEQLKSSGKDVITAYCIGTEVMVRLGQVMGYTHYDLGWHATDTLGTVGAAAACVHLLQLDQQQSANALAIAASMAGGLQKNFGTMTKPLHVGLAGCHAIQAVTLAKRGLTASYDVFGIRGFFHAFGGGDQNQDHYNKNIDIIRMGEPYDFLQTGLSVKKFPCCYMTHRFIKGVLDIASNENLRLSDIEEIQLVAPPGGLTPLIHQRPITGLQGKFSAEYTALAAVADRHVGLRTFEDEQVQRAEIQQALAKVKPMELAGVISEGQEVDEIPVQIRIKTMNGQLFETQVLNAPGAKGSPLRDEELREKFTDCILFAKNSLNSESIDAGRTKANQLFDHGLKIDQFENFSDWISEIHQSF